jgi:bifunctional non-homologous end joining protein LigD
MIDASEFEAHAVSFTHLDKLLYPAAGFRKRDLVAYYRAVAPVILPHLADRALQLGRWPDGVLRPGWFQANCPGGASWVRTHSVTGKRGQPLRYCVVDDLASLLWVANLGTLELHPFQATITHPDEPRAMVFDLDPGPGCDLRDCARAALAIRAALEPLRSFVKTSGVKGLHLYVPLNGGSRFAEVKPFAKRLARELAARNPEWLTDTMARSERERRVFIDCSQNDPGKQTVAPYSLRATMVPIVSMPLTWDEVADPPLPITPTAALERIERFGDLFADVLTLRQSVSG